MKRFVATSKERWFEKPKDSGKRPTAVKTQPLLLVLILASACAGGPASTTVAVTGEVVGTVVAGPTCPVEQEPPDPACADRPVNGAVIVILDPSGQEVTRVNTHQDGTFQVRLPIGSDYLLVPQPFEGLLGTAAEVTVTLTTPDQRVEVVFTYDTGIR